MALAQFPGALGTQPAALLACLAEPCQRGLRLTPGTFQFGHNALQHPVGDVDRLLRHRLADLRGLVPAAEAEQGLHGVREQDKCVAVVGEAGLPEPLPALRRHFGGLFQPVGFEQHVAESQDGRRGLWRVESPHVACGLLVQRVGFP